MESAKRGGNPTRLKTGGVELNCSKFAPQAKIFRVLLISSVFLRRRLKIWGTFGGDWQISSTPPRTVVECGVEYLKSRGGVGWSISSSRFSDTPPRTVVECGVEYLDRRGGVGWSFHLVLK